MILPFAFLTGAALGWWRASKRSSNLLDKLQYAAAHGFAAFLLVLALITIADRAGMF